MAQVVDPAQASSQIHLLTELRSRFPEVPVEVIKIIMQQVCYRLTVDQKCHIVVDSFDQNLRPKSAV